MAVPTQSTLNVLDLKEHKTRLDMLMSNSGPFVMTKKVIDASIENIDSLDDKGSIKLLYPPAITGLSMIVKLNRIYIKCNMDLKQLYKRPYETIASDAYLTIGGIKTKLNSRVQDLKSMLSAHSLGTWDVYDDFTFRIKWKKTVKFVSTDNDASIRLWFRALGLEVDTTYTTGTTTTIPVNDIIVQVPFYIALSTAGNNSILSVYGESSAQSWVNSKWLRRKVTKLFITPIAWRHNFPFNVKILIFTLILFTKEVACH